MPKYKYKIKEKNDEPLLTVINKTGIEAEFTINDIRKNLFYHERVVRELEAQVTLETAKMQNVLNTHPHVKEVSEEDAVAITIYHESKKQRDLALSKISEAKAQIEEDTKELSEIEKQTGLAYHPATPEQVGGKKNE